MVWLTGRAAGVVLAALTVSSAGASSTSTQSYVCYRPFFNDGRLLRYMLPCDMMTTDLAGTLPLVTHHALDSSMLMIHLSCTADPDVCTKVKTALDMVLSQVEYGVEFTAPIVVVMAFRPLPWGPRDSVAVPTREIRMVDQDGVERLYPQSLVKQFGVPEIEELFEPIDIEIDFNSEAEWAFPDECPDPRKDDFVGTAVLEILHGLGFASSWRGLGLTEWFTCGIMPSMSFHSEILPSGTVHFFDGFVELAMDRLLVEPGKRLLRERIGKVNTFKWSRSNPNTELESYIVGAHMAFEGSHEFKQAEAVFDLANQNPRTIYLAVPGRLYMETSIEFTIDKSLYDVDEYMYSGTVDALLFKPNYHYFPTCRNYRYFLTCRMASEALISDRYLRVLSELGYHTRVSGHRHLPARFAAAPGTESDDSPFPVVSASLEHREADDVFRNLEETWYFREW